MTKSIINQTGQSSLIPLLEGLLAQIHMDLSSRFFGRNRTRDLRVAHTSVKCRALVHWAKESLKIPSGPSSEYIHINIYISRNRTGDLQINHISVRCRALVHWAKVTDESRRFLGPLHPSTFPRHMGSGLHAQTGYSTVYAGKVVFERQKNPWIQRRRFTVGGWLGRIYANS